jgi:hypothetical protein
VAQVLIATHETNGIHNALLHVQVQVGNAENHRK